MFLARAKDPAFWQGVREKEAYAPYRQECLTVWEEEASRPMPELKLSDYMRFWADGDRMVYEKAYFARRRAVAVCTACALIWPEEPKYLTRLRDVIFLILNEYTWCLPAHQYLDGRDWAPDHIDLFAAETGWALAETLTLVGERFSDFLRDRIRAELGRRIVDSFLGEGRTFFWEDFPNNWASVCAGSVAATILHVCPERYPEAAERIDGCMAHFLGGYGDDGFCQEGIGYWEYGYGFYICWADLLRDVTGRDVFDTPKVATIAQFLQHVFLSDTATVSFSDGSRSSRPRAFLLDFLRGEYGPAVQIPGAPASPYALDHCGRYCLFLRAAVWLDENRPAPEKAPADGTETYYASDVQWYIRKTPAYGFAAKAGHNEEFHNHNDVGSFILARDGRQLFTDVGAPTYDRDYFRGETRYSYFAASSRGHSVPYFGPMAEVPDEAGLQKCGEVYRAREVAAGEESFALDMAGAYTHPAVMSLGRTFSFAERSVSLCDRFVLSTAVPAVERFLLLQKPTVRDGGFDVGGAICTFDTPVGACRVHTQVLAPHDDDTPETAWILDVEVVDGIFGMTVRF